MPWHKPRIKFSAENTETVILIHGLWRSIWAMEPLAKHLHSQGYNTVNLAYSSINKPMDYVIDSIGKEVASYLEKGTVHLVTHSLGGIIAREILPTLPRENLGRMVMLAPPNQGSEIINWLEEKSAPRFTLGPVGLKLGADQITAPKVPDHIDTAVIMGNKCLIPFFKKLIPGASDGIVSVERGKVEGMNQFHTLKADHTFIVSEPDVLNMTLSFLQTGNLHPDTPATEQNHH